MKLSEFQIGNKYKYRHLSESSAYTCETIIRGYPILVSDDYPEALPFTLVDGSAFSPVEEWVVLMWKDEHKNSVVVNSEFFLSEQSAINKWVENPLYIGTKQVS